MTISAINFDLLGYREGYVVLTAREVADFLLGSRFLPAKLVAWEGNYLKASVFSLVGIYLNHLFIVLVC